MQIGIKNTIIEISDYISFFGVLMIAFYLPISIAATNIGVGFATFFYLVKKAFSRDWQFAKVPVNKFLPAFFIFSVITIFNSVDVKTSSFGALKMLKYLGLFLVIIDMVRSKKRMMIVVWAFISGLLLVSIDGLVQFATGKDFIRGFGIEIGNPLEGRATTFKRIRASFHNSQDFATYLAVMLPLVTSLLRYAGYSIRKRLFLLVILLLSLVCAVFTYSRGTALTILIISVFYTVVKKDKIILPVLIGLGLTAPFVLAKSPWLWFTTRPDFLSFFYDGSRILHWQAAINMIKAHPFMGIGLNAFIPSYDIYKSAHDGFRAWYAHHTYLQLAAEVGLVGFSLFLGVIIPAVAGWWKRRRKNLSAHTHAVSLGLYAGLIGFLICGFLESNLQYSNLAVLFWVIFALNVSNNHIIDSL